MTPVSHQDESDVVFLETLRDLNQSTKNWTPAETLRFWGVGLSVANDAVRLRAKLKARLDQSGSLPREIYQLVGFAASEELWVHRALGHDLRSPGCRLLDDDGLEILWMQLAKRSETAAAPERHWLVECAGHFRTKEAIDFLIAQLQDDTEMVFAWNALLYLAIHTRTISTHGVPSEPVLRTLNSLAERDAIRAEWVKWWKENRESPIEDSLEESVLPRCIW